MDEGKVPFGKDGSIIKPLCKYEKFEFSAHPSQEEMLKSLKAWDPKKVFLVHGDKKVMPVFKKKIESTLGIETVVLQMGKKIEFD